MLCKTGRPENSPVLATSGLPVLHSYKRWAKGGNTVMCRNVFFSMDSWDPKDIGVKLKPIYVLGLRVLASSRWHFCEEQHGEGKSLRVKLQDVVVLSDQVKVLL